MASEKITNLVEEVKGLSVLELSELVKAIEEEFGVTAAAPVVVAGGAAAPAAEEKTEFDVVLAEAGASKKLRISLTTLLRQSRNRLLRLTLKTSKLSSKQPALKLNLSNLSELTLIKHRRATCGVFVYLFYNENPIR